jgi:anti-sigma factor RsiW
MNCRQSRGLFGAYWDDELTQAEREWLESHFAGCDGCRAEYEDLARGLELLGSLPRLEAEPNLAERALARARRATPAPDRLPSPATSRWVPITAAAALIALLGATVLQWTTAPGSRVAARVEPPQVAQPVLVDGAQVAHVVPPAPGATSGPSATAEVPDSLFDPSQDIEFILDPVTLRKGRAHPPTRLAPEQTRGEAAVITF